MRAGNLDSGNMWDSHLDSGNMGAGNLDSGNMGAGNLDSGNMNLRSGLKPPKTVERKNPNTTAIFLHKIAKWKEKNLVIDIFPYMQSN